MLFAIGFHYIPDFVGLISEDTLGRKFLFSIFQTQSRQGNMGWQKVSCNKIYNTQ